MDVEYVIYETPHPPDTGQPCEDEPDTACPDTENPDMDNPCLENRPQLNKEKRNPEEQNTDSLSTEGSNPIQSSPQSPAGANRTGRDWMRERESYRELILENIEYDYLCWDDRLDRDMLNELVELMVDTVCSRREMIRIAGDDYPAEVVKSRFLKLNSSHIEYQFLFLGGHIELHLDISFSVCHRGISPLFVSGFGMFPTSIFRV